MIIRKTANFTSYILLLSFFILQNLLEIFACNLFIHLYDNLMFNEEQNTYTYLFLSFQALFTSHEKKNIQTNKQTKYWKADT